MDLPPASAAEQRRRRHLYSASAAAAELSGAGMDLASAWMDPMFVPSPGMDGGADVPPGAAPADANARRSTSRRHKGGASGHTSNSTYSNHKSSSGASGYADADDGVGVLSPHEEHRKRAGLKPSADDATGAEAETNLSLIHI